MADNYYFDGDPATESARRHLERLLKDTAPRRKWPWIAAALAGAAAWYFWPRGKPSSEPNPPTTPRDGESAGRPS